MHRSRCAGALRTRQRPERSRCSLCFRTRRSEPGVSGIWQYEMLNGLGKGVARGRLSRDKAFLFWQEIQELPVRLVDVPADDKLPELALKHNLAVYDAGYLSLAQTGGFSRATMDGKLQQAAKGSGIVVIRP
jgi:predicted nucleic acid-binding protein